MKSFTLFIFCVWVWITSVYFLKCGWTQWGHPETFARSHSADWAVHNGTTVCPHLMMFMLSLSVSSYFIFFPSFCLWGCKCHWKFLLFKKKTEKEKKNMTLLGFCNMAQISVAAKPTCHEKWTTQQVWFLTKIRSDMQMDSTGGSVWKS